MAVKKEIKKEISQLNEKLYILLKEIDSNHYQGEENPEKIKELFRILHTLKSLTLMFEEENLSDVIHLSEQLINEIKSGKLSLSNEIMELLYEVNNAIASCLTSGDLDSETKDLFIKKIDLLLSQKSEIDLEEVKKLISKLPDIIKESLTESELGRIYLNLKKEKHIYLIEMLFLFETFEKDIENLTEKLKKEGEIIATIPGDLVEDNKKIVFYFLFATGKDEKQLKKAIGKNSKIKRIINAVKQKNTPAQKKHPAISETLTIETGQIDRLLGDIDELENAKDEILSKTKQLIEPYLYEKLEFQITNFNNKIKDLYKDIVNLRLISLWPLFHIVETTIKSTAKSLQKKVKIEIKGADTKIDKPIIDLLIEPLIHIARNALDHGIETPEERIKAGKQEAGNITIEAYQSENSVFITFSDDGRGIEFEKIRKKAKKMGIAGYQNLTEEQLIQLLFMPGFSTKDSTSKISGRGIGLDTVKTTLTSIGGDIFIKTEKNKGTTFYLKLPLTIAILPLFFVSIGDFIIGIPAFAVKKIEEFEPEKLVSINNRTYYSSNKESYPFLNLSHMLNKTTVFSEFHNVLTINFANTTIILLVESIIDHEETTIIPFKGKLKKLPVFSGVSRYKDKHLAFVINVNQLIEQTRKKYETKIKFTSIGF